MRDEITRYAALSQVDEKDLRLWIQMIQDAELQGFGQAMARRCQDAIGFSADLAYMIALKLHGPAVPKTADPETTNEGSWRDRPPLL